MSEMISRGRRILVGTATATFAIAALGGTGASVISAAGHAHTQVHVVQASGWGTKTK